MPNFKMELTTAGAALVAKGLAGSPPSFFALALGDGTPASDPIQMQALAGERLRLPITSQRVVENGIYLTGQIKLDAVETGFNWTELAVLATDPDTAEEKVYCYGYDAAGGTLPGAESNTRLEGVLEVLVKTYGMTEVTVVIDHSLIYLTLPDLENHNVDPDAHSALFAGKADLDSEGKVPPWQLPEMNYEPLGAVEEHNTDPDAHGGIFAAVNAQLQNHEARITRLEDSLFNDITGNPHTYGFDTLVGITVVSGCWNRAQARLEC